MACGRPVLVVFLMMVVAGSAIGVDPPIAERGAAPPLPLTVTVAPAKPPMVELPPLILPGPFENSGMPGGVGVSQPLQPVLTVEQPVHAIYPLPGIEVESALPHSWIGGEYLVWWPKSHPLPPLLTSARGGSVPRLGGPNTITLIGGRSAESESTAGGRFTHGFRLNEAGTTAVSVTYFFLNAQNRTLFAQDGDHAGRTLGRPIVNAATGFEDAVPVAVPGEQRGTFSATTSTRINGWEVTGLVNLVAGPQARVHALAGYRYFQLNEGLRLEQYALLQAGGNRTAFTAGYADQIDAQNSFHGGQIGFQADVVHGSMFLEVSGKLGIGQVQATVRVAGQSTTAEPGMSAMVRPIGVLAQPSNSTRIVNSAFAVLPEGWLKVGYRFTSDSRLYIGYNFLYLSEVVRPGEQLDRTIDPAAVPGIGNTPGLPSERPGVLLNRTDFYLQGLILGFELRY